jgi:hypothetical protein
LEGIKSLREDIQYNAKLSSLIFQIENRYWQKQIRTKYDADTDKKQMIIETKKPLVLCRETQATQVN